MPLTPDDQGGGALTGGFFVRELTLTNEKIARSEQLRDRLATFGQKGCTYVRQSFELFNEQLVINHE